MILTVYYDNHGVPGIAPTVPSHTDRGQAVFDLGSDSASLYRNISLDLSWGSDENAALFEWQPSWLDKPEDCLARVTDWFDAGTMQYKYVHGLRITADTGGLDRTVQIQYDGSNVGATLTVNHLGEMTKPYSFQPFKAHLVRLVPATTDAGAWRLMQVEWEVDLEPESTGYWVTQPTTWGKQGYVHIRDFQFAWAATVSGAQLNAIVDGTTYALATLSATGGVEKKQYFVAPPIKGKIWQLSLSGQNVQVYVNDCEFRLKAWGEEQYSTLKPIGGDSVTSGGAKI